MPYIKSIVIGAVILFPRIADAKPLFPNSVVSNDLEFIKTTDQNAFACITYNGTRRAEMPDKRSDNLMANGTHIFKARYKDRTSVGLWAHRDLGSRQTAEKTIAPVAQAIGKLPSFMRAKLKHVVIHKGDETAFAEGQGHFFVLYSENIKTRIRNHDLKETIFHESVHATLDRKHARSKKWRAAQQKDGDFITRYAARLPQKEDLAESALFAWAMLMHPGRLPQDIEQQALEIMPNRLAFFRDLFLSKPAFKPFKKVSACKT